MKDLSLTQLYSAYKKAQADNMHDLMDTIAKLIKEKEANLDSPF